VWHKRCEKARDGGRGNEVFQVWRARPQEIEMHKEERMEERRGGATTKRVEENMRTLWRKRSAPKRSKDDHGGIDHKTRSSNVDGVQGM